jgi:hypothetical protein
MQSGVDETATFKLARPSPTTVMYTFCARSAVQSEYCSLNGGFEYGCSNVVLPPLVAFPDSTTSLITPLSAVTSMSSFWLSSRVTS